MFKFTETGKQDSDLPDTAWIPYYKDSKSDGALDKKWGS